MSGPKRYAVQVFDDHLKDVFHLQARIGVLWELLCSKEIRDDMGRKIYSDEQWLEATECYVPCYSTFQMLAGQSA